MNTNTTPQTESPQYPPGSLQEFFDNTPEKWTKRTYARDVLGSPIRVTDEDAFCFCILGAIRKVYKVEKDKEIRAKIMDAIAKLFPDRKEADGSNFQFLCNFNDHPDTTFEDIKAVLKEANV